MNIRLVLFVMMVYWLVLIGSTINAYADPISISYREAVIKHVINNEGYENQVYTDTRGNKTVGIGHKLVGQKYKVGDYVSDELIYDWFIDDITIAIKCATKYHLSTNSNVNIVLTDMAFNLGCSGLRQFKLLRKHLNNGNYVMAVRAIKYSIYYNQITNRANRNIALINRR